MHDSPPRIDPVLNLARKQMERVADIHVLHLAIVSGRDETRVVEFDDAFFDQTMHETIPALIGEIRALGVIISSPALLGERYGAVVTLIDRTLEAFYVPIVRIVNGDTMVGDFRPIDAVQPELYQVIHERLATNWQARGDE